MNYYIRFFDKDVLVSSFEEAYSFLASIPQIKMDAARCEILRKFVDSPSKFPLRLKITPKVYALVLKTEETDIENLRNGNAGENERGRSRRQVAVPSQPAAPHRMAATDIAPIDEWKRRTYDRMMQLNDEVPGIYDAFLVFKRVVPMAENPSKVCYKDTRFAARMRANSAMDCYNKLVEHLKGRQDVDPRSQYPSAKSNKFDFKLLQRFEVKTEPESVVTDIPEMVEEEKRREAEPDNEASAETKE